MYVITAHQRHGQTDRRTDGQTDGRTSSDPMTATLLKHVAVKSVQNESLSTRTAFFHSKHVKLFLGIDVLRVNCSDIFRQDGFW